MKESRALLETFTDQDIVLVNVECMPTFRGREAGFVANLTYRKISMAIRMVWRVNESYTDCDYQAIFLEFAT